MIANLKSAPAQAPGVGSSEDILDITLEGNRISSNATEFNAYEVRNSILIQEQKARVRYQNGMTLPVSAEVLLANALRKNYNHRRTLSRNIVAATTQPRPTNSCAHHIVALRDLEASQSRALLFRWGIGINDADNGVFLPVKGVQLQGYPNATYHSPHHAATYQLTVYSQLRREKELEGGRKRLRSIKAQLLSGALSL